MRQLPQGAADGVVLFVVEGILEVVPCPDGLFPVRGVGFVGVEVDFFEQSVFFGFSLVSAFVLFFPRD